MVPIPSIYIGSSITMLKKLLLKYIFHQHLDGLLLVFLTEESFSQQIIAYYGTTGSDTYFYRSVLKLKCNEVNLSIKKHVDSEQERITNT